MTEQLFSKKVTFVLGGARSGKSYFAQKLARKLGKKVLFVATAEPLDKEMQARIEEHKKLRPSYWRTLEIASGIAGEIETQSGDAEVVVVDCLTLLVSNIVTKNSDYNQAEKRVIAEINELINCLDRLNASFIIVSNEVGLGIVPENELARFYRDLLGKVNQLISQKADEVYFMVAGIPLKIKGEPSPTKS